MEAFLLRTFLCIAGFLCLASLASAQPHYYDVWCFDKYFGLDFKSSPPRQFVSQMAALEGNTTISDPVTGELLFYTDGTRIWNRNHAIMKNGDGLQGHWSSTQASLAVPDPSDPLRYYLFATGARTSLAPSVGLTYSIIDMRGDGGAGEVLSKNMKLLSSACEKLVGVRHANGCGYWIITHEVDGDQFFAWLLTPQGFTSGPVISAVGNFYMSYDAGYLKASPNGKLLFSTQMDDKFKSATGELLRFNPVTGEVGPRLAVLKGGYGSSFSPDNHYLYTSDGEALIRYDLQVNGADIESSRISITTHSKLEPFWGMQIGPDGKIYVMHVINGTTYLGSINNPNSVAPSFKPQLYTLAPEGNLGLPNCIDGFLGESEIPSGSDTLSVRVIGDTVICPGEKTQLRAEGGIRYQWIPSTGLSCADCPSPVAFPSQTTSYRVIAHHNDACASISFREFTLTVLDPPPADAGEDITICPGEVAQLQASGGILYRWSSSSELSCLDCSNPIASPTETTTYVVQVTDDKGCTARDSVQINVGRTPIHATASATTICKGESVSLNATGGEGFQWSPPDGLSCTDCVAPTAKPLQTTTYVVRTTSQGICPKTDSVTIVVREGPIAEAGRDTAICTGVSLQLQATGGDTYRWDPSPDLTCLDCSNPVAHPMATSIYYVTAFAGAECQSRDSIRVAVTDPPVAVVGGDTSICEGTILQLNASGGTRYQWNPSPDLSCLDCPDPIARPTTTTDYTVSVFNDGGCKDQASIHVALRSGISVNAGDDKSICIGENVKLTATGGVRWQWEPIEGLSCTDCPDPIASPEKTTVYRVTAWSAEGCEGSDEVEVNVRTEPEIVHLRIGREYHGFSDQKMKIAVEIVGDVGNTDVRELEFELNSDGGVFLADGSSVERLLSGTALEGWSAEVIENRPGHLVVHVTALVGRTLSGEGTLLAFEGRLYLAGVRGTELGFAVRTPSGCFVFETEPGYAELDSICGLNFRLIELSTNKYVAPIAYPNPARERVTFEFGLGLDGPTKLEVFDQLGDRVGIVLEDALQSGKYSVEWDVRGVSSGVYWYRLTSGVWSEGGQVRVEQ